MMIRYIKIDPKKDTLREFEKFPGLRSTERKTLCVGAVRIGKWDGALLHTFSCERVPGHKGCHANYAKPYEVLVWDDEGAAAREFEYQLTGKFAEKI